MARKTPTWRPISITIWDDVRFMSLSDSGKLLWFHFLSSSDCPIPGVLLASETLVAERLGWTVDRVRVTFAELVRKDIHVCWEGRVVWCQNGFKHQPVCGPNAMVAMATAWRNIPDVSFKHALWSSIREACKGWSVKFRESFAEPSRRVIIATSPIDQVPLPLSEPRTPTPSPTPLPTPSVTPSGTPSLQEQEQEQEQDLEQQSSFSSSLPSEIGGGDLDLRARIGLAPARDPEMLEEFERLKASGFRFPAKGGAA